MVFRLQNKHINIVLLVWCGLLHMCMTHLGTSDNNVYCDAFSQDCDIKPLVHNKFLFYDVNSQEGFNLKRDVYMRFAIMVAELQKKRRNWNLILPPWHRLYHWRSEKYSDTNPVPWSLFFDINSLQTFAPVIELSEAFQYAAPKHQVLVLDRLYVLENFPNTFENGKFVEKWKVKQDGNCKYTGSYWGYSNITAKEIVCVMFQGKASKLIEIMSLHASDTSIMFANGEIALHDAYGSKEYWDCRKSMKFSKDLLNIADIYIHDILECNTFKCDNYVSVHWRRQDFARNRRKDIPSITGAANQIDEYVNKNRLRIIKVFIATDAPINELDDLKSKLESKGYEVFNFVPSENEIKTFKDGGIAIVDQIICSRGAFFIGTFESTFTFRIQEEREINGFLSYSTYSRLCPDTGFCEPQSKWTIVH